MLVGLEFNDTFDLTAVGTMFLAVVTLVSLYFGAKALSQTKDEIDVSRKEVEEAHRPVIVPIIDKARMDLGSDGNYERGPLSIRENKLVIPVQNIGSGPALDLEATVVPIGAEGRDGSEVHGGKVPGVAAGEFAFLEFQTTIFPAVIPFSIAIEYSDVAERGWRTTGVFGVNHYESVKLHKAERTPRLSGFVKPVEKAGGEG